MTVLIVAITHGRSKEGWYTWIKDRVEKNYGYETPSALPGLYLESRLKIFREAVELRRLEEEKAAQLKASTSSEPTPLSTGTCQILDHDNVTVSPATISHLSKQSIVSESENQEKSD